MAVRWLTRKTARVSPNGDTASDERRALELADVPWMAVPTAAGMPVTTESALRIVDVLACVRLLSESASVCPLHVYRRGPGLTRQRADGPLAELLRRPAPATSQANLIASTVASLALRGNAFWGKFRNAAGAIEQLAVIPPDRVHVELAQAGGEPVYTLMTDQGVTRHTREDVLHFRGLSLDGVTGLSPIQQAREALGLAAALTTHAAAMFGNAAIPKGVLVVAPGPGSEDVMENLAEGFQQRHGGPRNAGRVAVVSGEVQWQAVSLTPADTELLAERKLSSTEVARLFRVPPHMIGAESGASMTYANANQEADAFHRYSLAPHLALIEQGVSGDPDLCAPGEFVEFVLDSFLRPTATERAQVYEQLIRAEVLTVDEARQRENLPPRGTA